MMRAAHDRDQEWEAPGDGPGPRLPRFLASGEDPTMWSVPLYRLGRLRVRAHWVWIVGLILGVVLSVPLNKLGPQHVLTAMGWGILLVLAREHARHFIGGRVPGGESVAVLWDFGCMNLPEIESTPRRACLHAVGGTIFNLAMLPGLAGLVIVLGGGMEIIFFNPAKLEAVVGGLSTPQIAIAWWLHAVNLGMLCANLLPMLPMDAGRLLVVLRERDIGREDAVLRAARVGLYVACATLVAAIAAGSEKLASIALVGGFVCWMQTSRARLLGIGPASREAEGADDWSPEPDRRPPPVRSPVTTQADVDDGAEVDRILAKISREGMTSLTSKERRVLDRATRKRRGGQST